MPPDLLTPRPPQASESGQLACVLSFNANDPSGAAGLAADVAAIACVGAHALPIMTGVWARDSARIFDFYPLDDEAVTEQARAVLEDIEVQAIKLGFAGTPANLGVVGGLAEDYPELPLIAHMPDLSWWNDDAIDDYHEAFTDFVLPFTVVLTGNYSTLKRWLLPVWEQSRPPGARDLAIAAAEFGASFTLVTGIDLGERGIDNVLASPQALLVSAQVDRQDTSFIGAGDTLTATFTALVANGYALTDAFTEAVSYLDGSLREGFRPGMGHALPDRLFWAQSADATTDEAAPDNQDAADATTPPAGDPDHEHPH